MIKRILKQNLYSSLAARYSIFDNYGKIGYFGDIAFRVNNNQIVSPSTLSISKGAKTASHAVIGSPEITEFSYRNLRKINLKIILLRRFANIESIVNQLTTITEAGLHYPLIIGEKSLSENDFLLLSFDENVKRTDDRGRSIASEITLNLQEYISEIDRGIKNIEEIEKDNTVKREENVVKEVNKNIIFELEKKLW